MKISIASWNINCGRFGGPTEIDANSLEAGVEHLQSVLKQLSPDIVAIQELPYGPKEAPFTDAALDGLGYHAHRRIEVVSPSPFSDEGRSAMAIVSRFEILESRLIPMPTPKMLFVGKDSVARPMHAKGLLYAKVRVSETTPLVNVVCGHMPPFKSQRRAPGEPLFDELREALRRELEAVLREGLPTVVCADLNMNSLQDMLPGFVDQHRLTDLIGVPTRWLNGQRERSDHLLTTTHWAPRFARVIPSRFDHDLCFAELGPAVEHAASADTTSSLRRTVKILHLSDLHYGEASQCDVDWKVWIDGAERQKRVDRLPEYLRRMPVKADFLVVSGDITLGGSPSGLAAFQKVLLDGVKAKQLPDSRHTVLVPGNHDVDRNLAPRSNARWTAFQDNFGAHFVIPWLPNHESPELLMQRLRDSDLNRLDVIGGGHRSVNKDTGLTESAPLPFTFDLTKHVLIYAFNSSLISGSQVESGAKLEKYFESLKSTGSALPLHDELLKDLNSLRKVDPARIEPSELTLFHDIVALLRQRLPEEYEDAIKIAVLHHHVTPFISEEVKQFELLINAGHFKKSLVRAGFSVVLHGHKHWDDMVVDSALSDGGQLIVVSGGTIGGGPSKGKPGFNWLELSTVGATVTLSRYFVPIGADSTDYAVATSLEQPVHSRTLRVRSRPTPTSAKGSTSFAKVAAQCEAALLAYMIDSRQSIAVSAERVAGWNNYIGEEPISILGTTFCCRALQTIGSTHFRFLEARERIINFILSCRRANGFWSSTANREPGQPLETALVLSALLGLEYKAAQSISAEFAEALAADQWPTILESTYGLAQLLDFALRHHPGSPLVPRFCDLLKKSACLSPEGGILGWSESTAMSVGAAQGTVPSISLAPSVANTAFVLATLARAQSHPACTIADFPTSTKPCTTFLLAQPWSATSEAVRESENKELLCTHSTGNAALEALLLCGIDVEHNRLTTHVSELVATQDAGLWNFGAIKRPSWRVLSNLTALKVYASYARGLTAGTSGAQ